VSIITAIEPQKSNSKNRGKRFNIFIDGRFSFGASAFTIMEANLKADRQINQDEIDKLISKEDRSKLTNLTANLLSLRPRSEKEIKDYLAGKIAGGNNIKFQQALESPLIDQVIVKLKKYNYLNDAEFAKWFVASRNRSNPKGPALIKQELKAKGISADIIKKILSKGVNAQTLAQKALEKKAKSWKNLRGQEFKKKAYQYLAGKGFEYDTIHTVILNSFQDLNKDSETSLRP